MTHSQTEPTQVPKKSQAPAKPAVWTNPTPKDSILPNPPINELLRVPDDVFRGDPAVSSRGGVQLGSVSPIQLDHVTATRVLSCVCGSPAPLVCACGTG